MKKNGNELGNTVKKGGYIINLSSTSGIRG